MENKNWRDQKHVTQCHLEHFITYKYFLRTHTFFVWHFRLEAAVLEFHLRQSSWVSV